MFEKYWDFRVVKIQNSFQNFQNLWTLKFVLINWKYWINSTFEWEISRYHIEFNKTSKRDSFIQLFRLWHIDQLHIVLICLIRNVKQNQRISTLQKWQKLIHYRNSFETWKIMLKMCLRDNFSRYLQNNNAIFIIIQCAFVRFSIFSIF